MSYGIDFFFFNKTEKKYFFFFPFYFLIKGKRKNKVFKGKENKHLHAAICIFVFL